MHPAVSEDTISKLRTAVTKSFFSGFSPAYLATDEGRGAIEAQTMGRYNEVLHSVVPWVARHKDLSRAVVVEIGCGAGASTAAFARKSGHVTGYDIDPAGIISAEERMEILGIRNTTLVMVPPEQLLDKAKSDHPQGADVVLCYAVLEHQTFVERMETLRQCWNLLRDGGLFVVADTPNRLTYSDHHTSFLPFYHMLPHEVAVAYARYSPRDSFWPSIKADLAISEAAATERLIRWGRGVSYHEFELALGDLRELVVGDGFDPEVIGSKPLTIEEKLLIAYAEATNLSVPRAFLRQSIDVVLVKGRKELAHRSQSRQQSV